ncbi:MAG: hypothetical protein AABY09_03060, partial [Nanoarchaeota archaeon]
MDAAEPSGLEKAECTETDDGLSFATAGSVTGKVSRDNEGALEFIDKCMDDGKTLIEYYCHPWSGMVKSNKIYCKSGCQDTAEGSKCSSSPFCIDTDTENNPIIKGSLILVKANEEDLPEGSIGMLAAKNMIEIIQDVCDNTDNTKLIQHSCDASALGFSEMSSACDTGKACLNGVCRVPPPTPQESGTENKGMFGAVKSFLGLGAKAAVGSQFFRDGTGGGQPSDGSIECKEGGSTTVNGMPVACFSNRVIFSFQAKAGYNKMLNLNFDSSAGTSSS